MHIGTDRYNATTEIRNTEYNMLSFKDQIAKIFIHRKCLLYDMYIVQIIDLHQVRCIFIAAENKKVCGSPRKTESTKPETNLAAPSSEKLGTSKKNVQVIQY